MYVFCYIYLLDLMEIRNWIEVSFVHRDVHRENSFEFCGLLKWSLCIIIQMAAKSKNYKTKGLSTGWSCFHSIFFVIFYFTFAFSIWNNTHSFSFIGDVSWFYSHWRVRIFNFVYVAYFFYRSFLSIPCLSKTCP